MVELGDTTFVLPGDSVSRENAELESGEQVLLRFIRYTLEEYPDTISNWGTMDSAEPIKLQYMVNSETSCTGWQVALKYMKYHEAQCKIICPSRLGNTDDNSNVIPRGYDMKIQIKRF